MEFDLLKLIFYMVGGLGIFLLGMKNMSEGMQAVAGDGLRRMISAVTGNRISACLVGILVTATVQSSSVTTVTTVGLVNANIMTLKQAVGVILGANIGTTITAWIISFKVGGYGLPLLGISAFFYLFSKKDKFRYTAMALLGLGMVFFGLEIMKEGVEPLRSMPEVKEWFTRFRPDSFIGALQCCLVGGIITALIQSSSATIGITMTLVLAGIIDYNTAAALIVGENIGTTVTAYLASLGASTNAKRTAFGHMFVNLLGASWVILFFGFYVQAMRWGLQYLNLDPDTPVIREGVPVYEAAFKSIPLTHSAFNIINVLIFLPFVRVIVNLLERFIPEKKHKEKPHLTYIDIRMLDTPAIGIQQSQSEILRMGRIVREMLQHLTSEMRDRDPSPEAIKKINHLEEVLDIIQREITDFLGSLLSGTVPHSVMETSRGQLRMADELETIGDYILSLQKLRLRMQRKGEAFSTEGREEFLGLLKMVSDYIAMISEAVEENNAEVYQNARTDGTEVTKEMKRIRRAHFSRVEEGKVSPQASMIYMDMLNMCRRIKDHGFNIAEVLAGDK